MGVKSVFFKSPSLFTDKNLSLASSQNDLYYHKENSFFGENNLILFEGAFLKCWVIIFRGGFSLGFRPSGIRLTSPPSQKFEHVHSVRIIRPVNDTNLPSFN